ncbi:type II toxin-antitoxin system VapC family toxin [Thermococcus sp.]|uniref:type II toxin-antitoxin system VapC family toxin n=1 Tax=Thermococcus sp. TaxID=35749 RepID=UPI002634BBC4|nr:type II toxin-antitoxin system VapC family toxin [Thermococcus sp.]
MKVYADVNVIYYILTANEEFGIRAKELVEEYYGRMITSALTVWQLHVLLRRKGNNRPELTNILSELGIKIVPLTPEILSEAEKCGRLDFDDAIHYATMKAHRIDVILSNDRDFDKIKEIKRVF